MFKAFYNHVNNIIATAPLGRYYPALVNESPQRLIKLICSFIWSQFHGVGSNIYFITFLFFFVTNVQFANFLVSLAYGIKARDKHLSR